LYHPKFLLIIGLLTCFMVSCSAGQSQNTPVEVDTLRQYMRALTEKDEVVYSRLICPTWESEALLEFDAYKGVETKLGDMTCRLLNGQSNTTNVNCQGKILLSYGSEKQEIDLSMRQYKLTSNGDVWQVCGYTTSAP
jgi:hypothetical protein